MLIDYPVVYDFGTCTTKLGLAIQREPQIVPSLAARCSESQGGTITTSDSENDRFFNRSVKKKHDTNGPRRPKLLVGAAARRFLPSASAAPNTCNSQNTCGAAFDLSRPFNAGRIIDEEAVEQFWLHCYSDVLQLLPENHPVLLCESPIIEPTQLESTVEFFFDVLNVPRLEIAPQELMAIHSFTGAMSHSIDLKSSKVACGAAFDGRRCHGKQQPTGQWNTTTIDQNRNLPSMSPSPAEFTGIVVNVGECISRIASVAEGYLLEHCTLEVPVAGRHVSVALGKLVGPSLYAHNYSCVPSVSTVEGLDVWHSTKEAWARVSENFAEEHFVDTWGGFKGPSAVPHSSREFPGLNVECSASQTAGTGSTSVAATSYKTVLHDIRSGKFRLGLEKSFAAECLFRPEVLQWLGISSQRVLCSIPDAVVNVIQSSPIDCRRKMYQNVLVVGGGSMIPNFAARLETEIQDSVNERLLEVVSQTGQEPKAIKVHVYQSKQRAASMQQSERRPTPLTAVWCGGAQYALKRGGCSLGHSREEYEEYGPSIYHAKSYLSRLSGHSLLSGRD